MEVAKDDAQQDKEKNLKEDPEDVTKGADDEDEESLMKDDSDDADAEIQDDDAEDDDEEDGDDESGIGEFRIRVMANGNVRLVLDDDDDGDEDADEDEDSDDSADDASDGSAPDDELQRSADGTEADDDDSDDKDKKDKDKVDPMGKSSSTKSRISPRQVGVTEESLSKALEAVMQFAKSQDGANRQTVLMAKSQSDEGLTPAEAKELFAGMGKKSAKQMSLATKVVKGFEQDGDLQKSKLSASYDADVGEYLDAVTERTVKSIGAMCDFVEASDHRHHGFALLLSKAVGQIGAAVKLIGQRMQVIESQPTRVPKSLSVQPVNKSFAGDAPAGAQVSGHQLLDTLTRMNIDSMQQGRKGLSKSHRDIMGGIERAMSGLPIDSELLQDVQAYRQHSA